MNSNLVIKQHQQQANIQILLQPPQQQQQIPPSQQYITTSPSPPQYITTSSPSPPQNTLSFKPPVQSTIYKIKHHPYQPQTQQKQPQPQPIQKTPQPHKLQSPQSPSQSPQPTQPPQKQHLSLDEIKLISNNDTSGNINRVLELELSKYDPGRDLLIGVQDEISFEYYRKVLAILIGIRTTDILLPNQVINFKEEVYLPLNKNYQQTTPLDENVNNNNNNDNNNRYNYNNGNSRLDDSSFSNFRLGYKVNQTSPFIYKVPLFRSQILPILVQSHTHTSFPNTHNNYQVSSKMIFHSKWFCHNLDQALLSFINRCNCTSINNNNNSLTTTTTTTTTTPNKQQTQQTQNDRTQKIQQQYQPLQHEQPSSQKRTNEQMMQQQTTSQRLNVIERTLDEIKTLLIEDREYVQKKQKIKQLEKQVKQKQKKLDAENLAKEFSRIQNDLNNSITNGNLIVNILSEFQQHLEGKQVKQPNINNGSSYYGSINMHNENNNYNN